MFTLLLGINSFVFLSMRDVAFEKNLLYTTGLILLSIVVLSALAYVNRIRRKKSSSHAA
jgi:hypothetical protein